MFSLLKSHDHTTGEGYNIHSLVNKCNSPAQHLIADAGTIFQNTRLYCFTCHSTRWCCWNTFPTSSSIEAPAFTWVTGLTRPSPVQTGVKCRALHLEKKHDVSSVWVQIHTHVGTSCHSIWRTSAKHPKSTSCPVRIPCSSQIGASHQHLFHQRSGRWHSRTASTSSQWWMRLVEQGEGMLNSNQGAPLGLLSMGYFLKHLPLGYPSSDEQRSCRRGCRSETWGLRQWADTRQHLLRFSSPLFCHYMIKVIAGRAAALWQGQYSPPVINQWSPPTIRGRGDGFLCKRLRYTVQPALSHPCGVQNGPAKQTFSIKTEMYRRSG